MKNSNGFRTMDFWLLGGASIFVWAVLALADPFRSWGFVGSRFGQVGVTFAFLSLVCNHPHFMISYRIAYARGWRFTLQHWFSLLFVPAAMIAAFGLAFYSQQTPSFNESWTLLPNAAFGMLGLGFRFGMAASLGQEILGASVWVMYATAGWHYAKQAFGCMMVYANYDRYPLTPWQRRLTKAALFAVAIYNIVMVASHAGPYFTNAQPFQAFGMDLTDPGLPAWWVAASTTALVLALAAFAIGVLGVNLHRERAAPSLNFLVPLLAFFVWWIPVLPQREFYFFMVPFFHSMQYLAFSARMEKKSLRAYTDGKFVRRIVWLLAAGALAFEALPELLARAVGPEVGSQLVFFGLAVPVFLNVHHFFLDSVIWKFQNQEVKAALLAEDDPRRLLQPRPRPVLAFLVPRLHNPRPAFVPIPAQAVSARRGARGLSPARRDG